MSVHECLKSNTMRTNLRLCNFVVFTRDINFLSLLQYALKYVFVHQK